MERLAVTGWDSAIRRSRILRGVKGRFGLLLIALAALMAAAPLIIAGVEWKLLLTVFTSAVLVASLHASRPGGAAVTVGLGLAVLDFVIGRFAYYLDSPTITLVQVVLWIATLVFVISTILETIFASEQVSLETLQAALCVYLLIGLLGAFLFTLIEMILPGSFQSDVGIEVGWTTPTARASEFLGLFVFSFATLSGTGYSEISPATEFASNVASLQAMAGQIFVAVVIARLVGLHASRPRPGPDPQGGTD